MEKYIWGWGVFSINNNKKKKCRHRSTWLYIDKEEYVTGFTNIQAVWAYACWRSGRTLCSRDVYTPTPWVTMSERVHNLPSYWPNSDNLTPSIGIDVNGSRLLNKSICNRRLQIISDWKFFQLYMICPTSVTQATTQDEARGGVGKYEGCTKSNAKAGKTFFFFFYYLTWAIQISDVSTVKSRP